MNKWELFQKFLITQQEQIELSDFLINALIIVVLSFLLELTYKKCGKSLSNRSSFAHPFILVGFATMLIISVVKSSLALSLGLVGALSIVRFRAAIKEPEELAYLFLLIALGLALGANLRLISVVAFGIIELIIWAKYFLSKKQKFENLLLSVSCNTNDFSLKSLTDLVEKYFNKFELKRFDQEENSIETVYIIEAKDLSSVQHFTDEITKISKNLKVNYFDNRIA